MKRALRSVRRLLLVAVIAALAMGMNVFAADVFDYAGKYTFLDVQHDESSSVSGNCILTWYLQVQDDYREELYDEDDDYEYGEYDNPNKLYITVDPEDPDAIDNDDALEFVASIKPAKRLPDGKK